MSGSRPIAIADAGGDGASPRHHGADPFTRPQRSARRTAWLIASCSATFCARPGTSTRTRAGGGAARADSSSDRAATSWTGRPNPAAPRRRCHWSAVYRRPVRTSPVRPWRLRQEREDASPAVVEDDERARHLRHVDQPRDIVEERQIAEEGDGTRALTRARAPIRVRSTRRRRSRWRPCWRRPGAARVGRRRTTRGPVMGMDASDQERRTRLGRVAMHRRGPPAARSARRRGRRDGVLRPSVGPPRLEPPGSHGVAVARPATSQSSTGHWWNSVATREGRPIATTGPRRRPLPLRPPAAAT